MNNLINLDSIISGLNITDNKPTLQLSEISAELLQAIKTNKTGMLEILKNFEGFDFILHLDDEAFPVNIKNNISPPMQTGEKITFPIKINRFGNLTIIPQTSKEINILPKFDVVIETKENSFPKPILTPIKLHNFVEQTIKDIPLESNTKQQIIQIVKNIDVSLNSINDSPKNIADVQNLQNEIKNIITEIIKSPQDFSNLKTKLIQVFDNISGKQLSGEISDKINRLYVVKTPLGETYFTSEMKIPVSQKVVIDINPHAPVIDKYIKTADEIIKKILPDYKFSSDNKNIIKDTALNHLAEIIQYADPKIINIITSGLPLQNNNLVENMYKLYKGIITKDITQWLGDENIKELLSDKINAPKYVADLTNMLQSGIKETASWRIVEMPFFDGTQLSAMKIALRKDKEQKEKNKNKKTVRFVVETEFSKLGKFQFDGFSKVQSRSFDLIIRTSSKISEDFCSNIINLFKKSLYDLDYSGTIKINMVENFINFNEEIMATKGVYV